VKENSDILVQEQIQMIIKKIVCLEETHARFSKANTNATGFNDNT
jgi:hypothetical protein